jgi:endonuclease YncB( thermonuclease family)
MAKRLPGLSSMMRRAFTAILILLISPLAHAADLSGNPRIVDGDTLHINKTKIRLHGIDAPESKQTCAADSVEWPCGQDATKALADVINDQPVICKGDKRDRYKRLIAVCYVGETDLNAWMVRKGWALAYRRYSKDYVDEETAARDDRVGMWRGEFAPPWEWRRSKR